MPLKVQNGQPLGTPPNGAPGDMSLPITYASQGQFTDLCWAACCQMVLDYNHAGPLQLCDIASKVFLKDCCSDLNDCNLPEWPQNAYAAYGFSSQTAGGAVSPQSIQAWIAALYPIQTYFSWTDGEGSHTALIVGYYENGDLEVYDPQWGIGRQTYDYVLHAYGMGSWQDSWYGIARAENV